MPSGIRAARDAADRYNYTAVRHNYTTTGHTASTYNYSASGATAQPQLPFTTYRHNYTDSAHTATVSSSAYASARTSYPSTTGVTAATVNVSASGNVAVNKT